jgi:hypothetical protein
MGLKNDHLPQSSKNSRRLQKSNVQQPNSYFLGDIINKTDIFEVFCPKYHLSILLQNPLKHTKVSPQSISSWEFLILTYEAM